MDKERLKDLLFGYLNETLDQEELDELLSYADKEAYTEVFHEAMDREWETQKVKALLNEAEQEIIYEQIKADPRFLTITPFAAAKKGKFRLLSLQTISAAAVLVILSFGVYFYSKIGKHSASEYANDIKPGTNKAVLTLADGSTITLDDAKKGKVAEQAGINISKSADGQLVYTVSGAEHLAEDLGFNTLVTPKGGQYQVNLPDGTKVWLNAASSLKYPASFAAAKERRVILDGEAYFEVAHNKEVPFRVETNKQTVEVLGTHFNINAYQDEAVNETTLLEGSVKVAGSGKNTNAILKPGQQAEVGEEIRVADIDTETAIAWKNGDFILKDEDFKTTMRKIARWYDVDIVYDTSAPEDLELGGWVSRSKNISAVLKVIESTGKVHFKVQGRRVTVIK